MTHLDEFTLNEYLDHTLDAETNRMVESHLTSCPTCQQSLAELQTVFAALTAVTDLPLTTDFAPRVLQTIQPEPTTPAWIPWMLLAQLAGAALMLAGLWSSVQTVLARWQTVAQTGIQQMAEVLGSAWAAWVAWGTAVWQHPPTFPPVLELAVNQWAWLFLLAFAAWLVGNRLLINENQG